MAQAVEVRGVFPTPIWTLDLEAGQAARMNGELSAAIMALMTPRPALPPGTNWQTDPNLHEQAPFAELVALVGGVAGGIAEQLKLKLRGLVVTGCWANVNPPGGRNAPHTHPNNFLSAVYYVATPSGGDRITFDDPRPQAFVLMPPVERFTAWTGNTVDVEVRPGRLILFPAWLSHAVPTNRSQEERVSIAFNLMFDRFVEEASPPLWRGTVPVGRAGGAAGMIARPIGPVVPGKPGDP